MTVQGASLVRVWPKLRHSKRLRPAIHGPQICMGCALFAIPALRLAKKAAKHTTAHLHGRTGDARLA